MVEDQYCDTELCLSPGGRRSVLQTSHHGSSPSSRRVEERAAKTTHEQQQQMTIFYGSRVCVCDATELQARAIISMAKQEMAASSDTRKKNLDVHVVSHTSSLLSSPFTSVYPQLANPAAAGLSMTRSLQQFLHIRKARVVDQSANLCSHGSGQTPPHS